MIDYANLLYFKYVIKKIGILLMIVVYVACNQTNTNTNTSSDSSHALNFTTWSDLCFDRAASIWLIKNFVDSTATFSFQKFGTRITEGIPFDVPGAELGRQRNISCFESIIQKYEIKDPSIMEMTKIIHDIDVNKWGVKLTNEADSLELYDIGGRKIETL